jgi:hypothetical protein
MDLKERLKELEEQVSGIKDAGLRKVAFEKLLDSLSVSRKATRRSKKMAKVKGEKRKLRARSGRPGPKAVLGELLRSRYFDKPKTVLEIQEYLKHKKGHAYSKDVIAMGLLRMVRDEQVTRGKNEKGQYIYERKEA